MSRIEENEKVRKEIDDNLNDENLLLDLALNPGKAALIEGASMIPLVYDISKSLAVIADKLTEIPQGSLNAQRIKIGLDPVEGVQQDER